MKKLQIKLVALMTLEVLAVTTSCDKKKEVVEPDYVVVIEAIAGTVVYVLDTSWGRDTYELPQGKKQGLHGGHGYSVSIGCPVKSDCVYKVGGHIFESKVTRFKLRDK